MEFGRAGKSDQYPLYIIKIKADRADAKTLLVSAGMHGNEPSGPLGVVEFLKRIDLKKIDVNITILPLCNPAGFDRNKRRNDQRRDLNRHFSDNVLTQENKTIYSQVKDIHPDVMLALHEDISQDKFFLYETARTTQPYDLEILEEAKKTFDINTDPFMYTDPNINGVVFDQAAGALEDRLYADGVAYAVTLETPGTQDLLKRSTTMANCIARMVKLLST